MAIQYPYCPHGMNERACPMCFRNKPPKPRAVPGQANPLARPGLAQGPVVPLPRPVAELGAATLAATQAQARAAVEAAATPAVRMPDGRQGSGLPATDAQGNLVYPAHSSVIDRQARHPHASEGTAQVLKA